MGKPVEGRFHGCGHDGHTTTLLYAAEYLARTRQFTGTLQLIFQPAEELLYGGRVMVEDGLFDQFPATPSSACTICRVSRWARSACATGR
nr:Uncharacterized hydrolase YxeP [Klebsiella pneumoniae]